MDNIDKMTIECSDEVKDLDVITNHTVSLKSLIVLDNKKNKTANIKNYLLNIYKTNEKATHTFMNGGKLYIPYDELEEVYKILDNNLQNPPLTERINAYSEYFKFFIDVDDEEIVLEELYEVTNKMFKNMFN